MREGGGNWACSRWEEALVGFSVSAAKIVWKALGTMHLDLTWVVSFPILVQKTKCLGLALTPHVARLAHRRGKILVFCCPRLGGFKLQDGRFWVNNGRNILMAEPIF